MSHFVAVNSLSIFSRLDFLCLTPLRFDSVGVISSRGHRKSQCFDSIKIVPFTGFVSVAWLQCSSIHVTAHPRPCSRTLEPLRAQQEPCACWRCSHVEVESLGCGHTIAWRHCIVRSLEASPDLWRRCTSSSTDLLRHPLGEI
jgi:hypothetical protein